MVKGNGGYLGLRWSYNQIDKDPEVDVFRTLYQKQRIKEDDLAAVAGLSTSTVKNMFGGKTRRPQHQTFAKLAAAMGHEYGLKLIATPDYATVIPQAKEERAAYREKLRKKREREAARGK
ncbi:helix-turn-helix domain-containing protein [Bradyrhizobium diazoefficiens]